MIRKTKDGKEIRIQDMTTEHIKNAWGVLWKLCMYKDYDGEENFDEYKYERWKTAFIVELVRRGEYDFILDKML